MAVKKRPEEHENHERWLISYADFITLLFAFFVVMYSSSSRDLANIKKLEVSLIKSFGSHSSGPIEKADGKPFADVEGQRHTPIDSRFGYGPGQGMEQEVTYEDMFRESDPLFQLKGRVDGIIRANGAIGFFQTKIEFVGLRIILNDDRVFTKNGDIKDDAKKVLKEIAKELRALDRNIAVEGLTAPTDKRDEVSTMAAAGGYSSKVGLFLKTEGRLPESRVGLSVKQQLNAAFSRAEDLENGIAIDIVVTRERAQD